MALQRPITWPYGGSGDVCIINNARQPFRLIWRSQGLHALHSDFSSYSDSVCHRCISGVGQEVVGDGTDVMEMSEGVFAEALADYPGMELAWLQLLYDKAAQQAEATPATLSMPSVLLSGFRSKVLG